MTSKHQLFATNARAAAMLMALLLLTAIGTTACSGHDDAGEPSFTDGTTPVAFGTDVDAVVTRTTIDDLDALKALPEGFGVLAYFTDTQRWSDAKATTPPNFMYNQPVTWGVEYVTTEKDANGQDVEVPHLAWTYSPVKYWPNYNDNDLSLARYVSFFAYAPYTATASGTNATGQTVNVTSLVPNTQPQPYIDYTLGAPGSQQDLLYAACPDATRHGNGLITVNGDDQAFQMVPLLFRHALSVVDIYVVRTYDEPTPTGKAPDNVTDTRLFVNKLELAPTDPGLQTSGRLHLDTGTWDNTSGTTTPQTYSGDLLAQWVSSSTLANEATKWDYRYLTDGTRDDANGTQPAGVIEQQRLLTRQELTPFFIPQTVTFTPTLTYSMTTRDDALLTGTEYPEGSQHYYFRMVNTVTGNPVTLTFEGGKRYQLLLRIGAEHIALDVISVEDWDFPLRFTPSITDYEKTDDYEKTLNE